MFSVANITVSFLDYPSPEDHAICVYFQGCWHNCPGCHSPALQSFKIKNMSLEQLLNEIHLMSQAEHTTKVVLSGGDPLQAESHVGIQGLLQCLNDDGFDVCIYSGYSMEVARYILGRAPFTYAKCGPFKQELQRPSVKTDTQFILASSNQDFYNNDWTKLSDSGILDFTKE